MGNDYSYNPLGDSLLGELICSVWKGKGRDTEELKQAIYSHLSEGGDFKGTPKGEKQIIMNLLPNRIRKYIEEKNFNKIAKEFTNLLKGRDLAQKPAIDVAFELLEWILTGFQEDDLVLLLLPVFFNNRLQFDKELLDELKVSYQQLLVQN
ncbi:MAG: hypothetical protein H7A23_10310 [Leptospiraceae bacterium]|nr:hypothetical protein [Leptospiraceae bacterium]MCP5494936.1 hypothetical protein [Leptospiraceae bacterium]